MNFRRLPSWIFVFTFLFLPGMLHANPGLGGSGGFLQGVQHPLTGLDHLLAMLAVGLWAVQLGGRARWMIPLGFVALMAAGGILGMGGWAIPFVEQGILISIVILGLLIAAAVRWPLYAGVGLVGIFAIFHGHAHGTEMPAMTSGLFYALGFVLMTALLHGAGMGLGLGMERLARPGMIRWAGAAAVVAGFVLAVF